MDRISIGASGVSNRAVMKLLVVKASFTDHYQDIMNTLRGTPRDVDGPDLDRREWSIQPGAHGVLPAN
jgi:hypothetical protein